MNRLKKATILYIFVLIVLNINGLWAQTSKYIEIDAIRINGKVLPAKEYSSLVISEKDSITFEYHCESGDAELKKNSYFYRVMLKNKADSSIKVTAEAITSYKNLPEDKYSFVVSAFDLDGKWEVSPREIAFDVNNVAAEIKSKNRQLQKSIARKDSLLKATLGDEKPEEKTLLQYWPYAAAFGIGIVITAIIAFLISLIRSRSKIDISSIKSGVQMAENDSGQVDLTKLKAENTNLRAEIASLRGQIDALQARGDELSSKNKELEENVNKLSSTKDELEQLQQQKDELFAVIIHDIKNPAALIKSLVELLRSYDLTATEQQEVIEDIAETTLKIVALSHEVSRILALEGSKLQLNVQQVQVGEIVRDVFNRNMIAAENKNIEMLIETDDNMPEAECDPQKIDEVIENLLSNAIKFTQKGGKVRIKAHKEAKNIQIEVSDNGLGLSQEDINHAFKRGSKLSASPTGGESSTGLGLWIVKKLIESHNGRVWVKSALGKGSTFFVTLPLEYKGENL